MRIYHGHPSTPSLEKCRRLAPSHEHGAEFSDLGHSIEYNEPYIIDNGAFAAFKNDTDWDPSEFEEMLAWVDDHQRDPDFVVVPDVVGEANATFQRSHEWASRIDYETYQPVQDGMGVSESIEFALETGSVGVFVGGSKPWKKRTAHQWIQASHEAGLRCHIARPWDLVDALELGADSVDTTTVVAWSGWDKLRRLEEHDAQAALSSYA